MGNLNVVSREHYPENVAIPSSVQHHFNGTQQWMKLWDSHKEEEEEDLAEYCEFSNGCKSWFTSETKGYLTTVLDCYDEYEQVPELSLHYSCIC